MIADSQPEIDPIHGMHRSRRYYSQSGLISVSKEVNIDSAER
jgi:hypothetical protein